MFLERKLHKREKQIMEKMIQQIKKALSEPLPGEAAQFKMAHLFRRAQFEIPSNAKKAAVMLLLFPKNNEWHTVLIQRTTTNENDKHSGQISFPGGKLEPDDISMEVCAKRETFEEVGVAIEDIEILGALTPLYIPVSYFHVFPFVGVVGEEPDWKAQQSEVRAIMTVPVTHFLDEKNKGITELNIQGVRLEDVPYYEVDGKKIWGATAMIFSEFCHLNVKSYLK